MIESLVASAVVLLLAPSEVVVAQEVPEPRTEAAAASDALRQITERLDALDARQQEQAAQSVRIVQLLDSAATKLEVIHDEVDRPLISELWFGFVSDRVTTGLNRLLGLESGPSTPLWTAGVLSLLLLLLKILALIAKPDGKAGKLLGKTFTALVSVYLIILTCSLFFLALNAPGSAVASFEEHIEASDELTARLEQTTSRLDSYSDLLEDTGGRMEVLGALLSGMDSGEPHEGGALAVDRIEALLAEQASDLSALKRGITDLGAEVELVESRQHGWLWTALVGLAALAVVAVAAIAGFVRFQQVFSDR